MNPYTQSLVERLKDPALARFVGHWDLMEGLVIRVYKRKRAGPQDAAEHKQLIAWLSKEYPRWQAALAPYWPLALAAGQPLREDPFAFLLGFEEVIHFVGNRAAIVTLPAARQALNQFLLDRLQQQGE